jgi:hypothetical protein
LKIYDYGIICYPNCTPRKTFAFKMRSVGISYCGSFGKKLALNKINSHHLKQERENEEKNQSS